MYTVGLLVPNSNMLPRFGRSFKSALELGMGLDQHPISIVMETGGTNSGERSVRNALQRLVLNHEPDVVVAPLNPSVLIDIEGLLISEEVPLLAITLGENRPSDNLNSDWIRLSSYGLWESAWLTGYSAVKKYGQRVALASAFHEAGYGLGEAVDLGVQAAGGELVNIVVTRDKRSSNSRAQTFDDVLAVDTDSIILNYSGDAVLQLNNLIEEMGLETLPPLLALPMVVDEIHLTNEHEQLNGMRSYLPKGHSRVSASLQEFHNLFFTQTNREPNVYALQAYQAGSKLINLMTTHKSADLASTLFKETELFKPFDTGTNKLFEERELVLGDRIENRVCGEITLPESCVSALRHDERENDLRGWSNPYLIT